jgi:hypothetical protein
MYKQSNLWNKRHGCRSICLLTTYIKLLNCFVPHSLCFYVLLMSEYDQRSSSCEEDEEEGMAIRPYMYEPIAAVRDPLTTRPCPPGVEDRYAGRKSLDVKLWCVVLEFVTCMNNIA